MENHSTVTRWQEVYVLLIHSAPLQSQFRLPAAVREMSPRCSLKRVDEDSLFQALR